MADEKKMPEGNEVETGEIVPAEQFDEMDRIDDSSIVAMMTGQAIESYVYSFTQGKMKIQGLTLAGINEAANRRGGIQVDTVDYTELPDSWVAVAKATDSVTNSSRYGAFEQPKMMYSNRPDPFAFTKAIHKAQRNAIKQLIPTAIITEVLNFYLSGGKTQSKTNAKTEPLPENNDDKACFAILKDLEPKFKDKGLKISDIWDFVKERYNIKSRSELSLKQWAEIRAQFQAAKNDEKLFSKFCGSLTKRVNGNGNGKKEPKMSELSDEDKLKAAKESCAGIWNSVKDQVTPLIREEIMKLAVNAHGAANNWNANDWMRFGLDMQEWKTNYINVAREEKLAKDSKEDKESNEQDILDEIEGL